MTDVTRLRELELTLEGVVEPRHLDAMGHMNVAWYVDAFNRGVWTFFARYGLDEPYLTGNVRGMFALEERVRYFSELREGEALEVYTGVLEVRPKTLRLGQFMVDRAKQVLSATREVVAAHIDLTKRRSIAFEPQILSQLEAAPRVVALPGKLTEAAAKQLAHDWIDAWNRRDAEAVLAHYAEDAVFVSPKAALVVGRARLEGKTELRSYWLRALEQIPRLQFTLGAAHWSPRTETLTVVYDAQLGDMNPVRATEVMTFRDGRIVQGEALYGASK